MKIIYRNILSGIFLLIQAGMLYADEPVWYQFEVIIFAYTNPQYTETESWPDQTGLPDYTNPLATISDLPPPTPDPSQTLVTAKPAENSDQFQLLTEDQLILGKEAKAIKRSSLRKLIKHTGWIQTMHARNESLPVVFKIGEPYTTLIPDPDYVNELTDSETEQYIADQSRDESSLVSIATGPVVDDLNPDSSTSIDSGNNPDYATPMIPQLVTQLDGTITISIGRYLHVWTDLLYHRPFNDPAIIGNSDYVSLNTFRYQDHRRMRSKELHYIDNPSFGILIYALPYKTIVENKE